MSIVDRVGVSIRRSKEPFKQDVTVFWFLKLRLRTEFSTRQIHSPRQIVIMYAVIPH